MGNTQQTATKPEPTNEPYGDFRDIVRQSRAGLTWERVSSRPTKNGSMRLAVTAVDACGFKLPITAWRNVDQAHGSIKVEVSLPSYVSFTERVSERQRNDVLNALRDSFLKYAEDSDLDPVHNKQAGVLRVDPTTGRLVAD